MVDRITLVGDSTCTICAVECEHRHVACGTFVLQQPDQETGNAEVPSVEMLMYLHSLLTDLSTWSWWDLWYSQVFSSVIPYQRLKDTNLLLEMCALSSMMEKSRL